MKKKVFLIISILIMLLAGTPDTTQAKSSQISLMINGNYITGGAAPVSIKDSVYIPLRAFFENVNFTVEYHPDIQTVAAWSNKYTYRLDFKINSSSVIIRSTLIGGSSRTLNIINGAIIYNGSVYVPLRTFGELLGANVQYDIVTRTVEVSAPDDAIKRGLEWWIPNNTSTSTQTDTGTTKTPLTVKQIAKLMDRVGYVEAYDQNGTFASGSGFQLNNGYFITNSHVAFNAYGIKVKIDGTVYDTHGWYWFNNSDTDVFGTVLSTSYSNDGKVIGTSPTKGLNFTTTLPEVGDTVYAIGSPLGLENTVSEGIVSGIRTDSNGQKLIQHTADTDHGSSGGVLLNEYGEVIGITSSGFDGTNLDFAVPMIYVQQEIDKLLKK